MTPRELWGSPGGGGGSPRAIATETAVRGGRRGRGQHQRGEGASRVERRARQRATVDRRGAGEGRAALPRSAPDTEGRAPLQTGSGRRCSKEMCCLSQDQPHHSPRLPPRPPPALPPPPAPSRPSRPSRPPAPHASRRPSRRRLPPTSRPPSPHVLFGDDILLTRNGLEERCAAGRSHPARQSTEKAGRGGGWADRHQDTIGRAHSMEDKHDTNPMGGMVN